jgi:ABC-type dipeptide/oligopeptide/nickel transport system permease component
LRNSQATLFTAWVNQVSLLVFSTIVVEYVFSFRGIGALLIRSIQGKDLPVLSGIILLNGLFFLIVRAVSRDGQRDLAALVLHADSHSPATAS